MRSYLFVSAGILALTATPAEARNGAWYVGGDFGAVIVEDTEVDIVGIQDGAIALNHDYGFDGALFVGYDLGAFRLEAEAAYKKADLESFENSIVLPSSGTPHPVGEHDAFGSTSALSFMINGMLDFGDDDGISGFVGGGVGYAKVDYNSLRAFETTGEFLDDSDSRFAWQIVAGLRTAIADNIDVTVRYRYFNVAGLETINFNETEDFKSSFRSHSLLGGITFNFGAPPDSSEPRTAALPERVTIYFDPNRSELTPAARAQLDRAIESYRRTGSAEVTVGSGGALDKPSPQAVQQRISNLQSYLSGNGVPEGQISVGDPGAGGGPGVTIHITPSL